MEQNLSSEIKDYANDLKSSSQVLIQRHAMSVANEEYAKIKDHSDFDQLSKWILDPSLRDPKLSKTGHYQWKEVRPLVNTLKIHTIFVSPMRRTLETAYHTYKTHPDFERIRFVLLPTVRESLNTSSDFPSDVDELITEFREVLPNLDTSLMEDYDDRKHYFIEDLQPDIRDKIKAELEEDEDDPLGSNAFQLFIRESKAIFPARLESKWNVYDRSVRSKNFIRNYIRINQVPKDQKVVVLSHWIYFYMHTGKWEWKCDRSKELSYPSEFKRMKNCEIVPDPSDYSSKEPI